MLLSTVSSIAAVIRSEIVFVRNAAQWAVFAAPRPASYIHRQIAEWRSAAGWALAFAPRPIRAIDQWLHRA